MSENCKCEEFSKEVWLQQFNANYSGQTEQAKELEGFVKSAYKGGKYIPWAVMERMLYQQDPCADFKIYENAYGIGYVFTDEVVISSFQKDGDKSIETRANAFSHMVKVEVTFLGKTVVEIYPIQDSKVKGTAYTAPKTIDQNLVNNAIKRALTKAAARVSGLALKLYENGDLQFETEEEPTGKPTEKGAEIVPKTTKKVENVVVTKIEDKNLDNFTELATYLHKNTEVEQGIKLMNTAVFKKYKFVFDLNESVEEIADKLTYLDDAEKFVNAVKFQSGVK